MLFEVRDQFDAMRRALFREAQRIDFELDAHQAEVVPQALAHHDDFSVGVRAREAQRFHADLMELAIAAALRTLVTEHRADVPQALRTVVQHVVLDRRAHHRRRVFGAHGQIFTVQRVGEAVHLFLDDVGHFADTALEQLRMLDDRRTNILVSVRTQHRLDGRFEKFPQPGFLRKDVVHALHAGELFELFLLFSHLCFDSRYLVECFGAAIAALDVVTHDLLEFLRDVLAAQRLDLLAVDEHRRGRVLARARQADADIAPASIRPDR